MNKEHKPNLENLTPNSKQEKIGTRKLIENRKKCPIKLNTLQEYWDLMKTNYSRAHKKMKMLDGIDSGDLWKTLNLKFPEYQVLPDTNFINYVKSNIIASLYTVTKSADVLPTTADDKELCMLLNIALEREWALGNIGYYQFLAGCNAALFNVGYTQVGWDDSVTAGSDSPFHKGKVSLKNINPIKFMRDPFSTSLDTAGYCCTYDTYHKTVFEDNPNYKETFKEFVQSQKEQDNSMDIPKLADDLSKSAQKDYYTLITYWIKQDNKLYEIHVINNKAILYFKQLEPAIIPIVELYCEPPGEKLIGAGPCHKIFANNVAYNIMESLALTAEYRNQRPPKFVNAQSNLNVAAFSKYGDEADKTFVVSGDASKAVHYQEFPQISNQLPTHQTALQNNIQLVTGVDGRYTGRDTGSIITTGGTEEMLNRVTMIDTPKIMMYEQYTKALTKLILTNLINYCPKRKYFRKKPNTSNQWSTITVEFPKIDSDTVFDYEIVISSELPKNKQSIAELANMLMEKQMQYQSQGQSVELITAEEWLALQDLPFKELMLERMGMQRLDNATEDVAQVLFQYADLIEKGAKPEDAITATANSLAQKRAGVPPEPEIPGLIPEGSVEPIGSVAGLM